MFACKSSRSGAPAAQLDVPLDGTDGTTAPSPSGIGGQCPNHQLSFNVGDSTVGTISVFAQTVGGNGVETVFEEDGITPLVIDLAGANEPITRTIEGFSIEFFRFIPAGLNGSENITATIVSGD